MSKFSGLQGSLIGAVGLFLFAGLALLILIILPRLIGIDSYKAYVLAKIESQLDNALQVSDISLSVFPRTRVDLEHIALLDPVSAIPVFSADRLTLDLSLLSLLRREIVVKRLELDRPRLNLHSEHLEHLHFSDLFSSEGNGRTPMVNVLMFSSSVREVAVRNGQIGITPHGQNGGMPDIQIDRVNLTVITPNPGTPSKFSMRGILPHDNDHAKIHVTGKFSSETIQPSPSTGAQHEYRLVGTTRISSLDLARLHPYLGTNDDEEFYGLADLEGTVAGTLTSTSRRLSIQDISLHLKTGNLTGSIAFQQTNDEPWTVQGEVNTSPFNIQTVLTVFSPHLDKTTFYDTVAESEVSGNVRIVQASVSSVLNMIPPSDIAVTAEFELKDMHGRLFEKTFENINASVILQDDTLELRSLSGRYGKTDVLRGIGIVTALHDEADIDSTITFMVPTSEFMDHLGADAPRQEEQEGSENIWEYGSRTGNGILTLEILGSLHSDDLEFEGVFQSRGMGFHSAWLGLPVSKLFGQLSFSPDGIKLKKAKGRIGRSRVQVNAHFAEDDSTVQLQSHADAKELVSFLLSKTGFSPLSPDILIQGTTSLNLKMDQHANDTVISAKLDLKKTGYHRESGISKPVGVAASADADVVLQGDTQVKIQRIRFGLAPLLLTASGHIALTAPPQYSFSVASNPVRLDEFHERAPRVTVRGLHPEAGLFKTRLNITGVGMERKAMKIEGKASLLHGRISVPETPGAKPLTIGDVNTAIQFSHKDDGRIEIREFSAAFNNSSVHITGEVTGLHTLPRIQVSIDAPQFDFESVIPQNKSSPLRELITSLSRTTILQSDIHVEEAQYHGVVWSDIHLAATGMGGVITLEVRKAQSGDGNLQAHATIHMPKNASIQMNGHTQFTAVPAQDIVTLLGGNERLMFGHANIKGELAGNGGHKDGVSATLDGQVHLALSDGRIRKFTALSKMLNLLNLPQLLSGHVPDLSSKGLAFDSIESTLVIKKGIVTIENLSINSPIMKIGGVGHYDIPNDNVNVVMAMSPLGSYENILNKIPVLNKIFAGGNQRRGILTTLFEVKGPLNDPQVTVMPGESVTSGLTGLGELAFDILRNTILLPKELIAPTVPSKQ